jgi:hypothetical protein
MKAAQKQLRLDIERKIGFKIMSSSDVKAFINILIEYQIVDLSFNTLRRFWALLPQTKASQNTLNKLSIFLGYPSFFGYVKEKNKFELWHTEVKIQRLKYKEDLSSSDLKFINKICLTQGTVHYFISLFEHAVQYEKWNYIHTLFNSKYLNLFGKTKTEALEYNVKIAALIFMKLKSIPLANFKKIITKLIEIKNFKENIIYIFVDLNNINGRYGYLIDMIAKNHIEKEEEIFIKLLKGQAHFLNHGTTKKMKIDESILLTLPETLRGRYLGFQILHASQISDQNSEQYYWRLFFDLIAEDTDIRNYLHEFIHHLLLAKQFEKMDDLMSKYFDDILDLFHVHHYLDVFLYNLIDAMSSYRSSNVKRANIIFKNLDLDKLIFDSYCDYYLIFYNITGYHLSDTLQEKNKFKQDYLNSKRVSGFMLFSEDYLLNYFES